MRTVSLSIDEVSAQIAGLLAAYPDLADDEDLRRDMLEGSTDIDAVLTRLVDEVEEIEALVAALAEVITTKRERKARLERKAEFWRALILKLMERADLAKFPLATATLSVRKTPARVVITDEVALPARFLRVRTVTELDKAALAEALKAGEDVPSAHLGNGGTSLTIRTK